MRELLPLIIIGGSFTLTGAVLYGAWQLGRYRGRDDEMPADIAHLEGRLARVEFALSQVTNALERVEAAHRHTARLMTDAHDGTPRISSRIVTPH